MLVAVEVRARKRRRNCAEVMSKKEVEDALKADAEKGCQPDPYGHLLYILSAVIVACTLALIFYSC